MVLTAAANESGVVECFNGTDWVAGNKLVVSENGTYKFRVTDLAGNVTEKEIIVDKIDKVAPTMEISGNAADWTNKDVVLTAAANESGVVEYFNGTDWVAGNKLVVSENGTYKFRVTDLAGNVAEQSVVVDKIDKVAPIMEISGNAADWTNKDVVLSATVSDGVVEYFANGDWVAGDKLTVSENGTYQFRVTDLAGNVTTQEIVVDKIDKVAPTMEISGNATAWTNKDVVLSATVSDGVVEYFNGTDWVAGDTITATDNGTYKFRVTDLAGNVTEKEIIVDKIDKVAPTMEISGNAADWTNKDVVLTAAANESGVVEYFADGKWVSGDTLTVSQNGTYTFRVTDIAGNVTEKSVTVDKIDKTAPETPSASADITEETEEMVTVTAVFSADSVTKEYSYDGSEWFAYESGVVFEENGSVYFRSFDAVGNVSETVEYVVENISALKKPVPSADITAPTNGKVTVTAVFDNDSVQTEYSLDCGSTWKKYPAKGVSVKENCTVSFRSFDAEGNASRIVDYIVSNIDKTAPEIPAVSADTALTNGNVAVTAVFDDDTVVKEYSFDKKNWLTYTDGVIMENNGKVYFRGIDAAGNISKTAEYAVKNIDKTLPEINGSASVSKGVYTLTFSGKDDSGIEQYKVLYSTDGGKTFKEYRSGITGTSLQISDISGSDVRFRIQAQDGAGNWSESKELTPSVIEVITGDEVNELIFISKKYTNKINGKKQNGTVLEYGVNAFESIEAARETYGKLNEDMLILIDSKISVDLLEGVETVSGAAVTPTIKESANSYSYKATSTAKNSLTITESTGETDFIRFATVAVSNNAVVGDISGGKENSTINNKTTEKKDSVTDTESQKYSFAASGSFKADSGAQVDNVAGFSTVKLSGAAQIKSVSGGKVDSANSSKIVDGKNKDQKTVSESEKTAASGKVTLEKGTHVDTIDGYTTVTVNGSSVGTINNNTVNDSKSESTTYDDAKQSVTRKVTLSHSESSSGTLKATDAELGDVTGFSTVTLTDVAGGNDFRRVTGDGGDYSTVKESLSVTTAKDGKVTGKYTKTVTFDRSGKLTATDSVIGDVENFNTVTLNGTSAGKISNIFESKSVVSGVREWENMEDYGTSFDNYDLGLDSFKNSTESSVTKSLSGSVTLKNGAAAVSVTDFKTLTMTGSEVGTVTNVSKVTVNKGDSAIGSYTGSAGSDTLSVAKGAVLVSDAIDLGSEDTVKLSGTLVMKDSTLNAGKFTGKGEIAAADGIELDVDFGNIVNVGATSENFRGTAYEMADDKLSKAVKWDGSAEYCGWLGSWEGYAEGSDTLDFIKIKIKEESALTFSDNISVTLLDKKGNAIEGVDLDSIAAGEYVLQIEQQKDKTASIAYSVKLG